MFKTQFSGHSRYFSNPGSIYMDTYSPKVDKSGHTDVVKSGKSNLHELIQADKDSVDINLIIKRYTAGDLSAIDKVRGIYMNTLEMPTTYAEFLQRNIDANILFERLPVDIKQKFDNSADVFWSNFGDARFLDVFGLKPKIDPEDVPIDTNGYDPNVGGEE